MEQKFVLQARKAKGNTAHVRNEDASDCCCSRGMDLHDGGSASCDTYGCASHRLLLQHVVRRNKLHLGEFARSGSIW
jgi:hypothetical protein